MATWLLIPDGAHVKSHPFRGLKKSLPHVSYASSPLWLCPRTPFYISPPLLNLIHVTSRNGVSDQNACPRNFFFFFFPWETCPPFHALLMEVEPLKHRPEVKRTLMGLPLHCPRFQCCLTPALPAGPAAHSVCQSVMQKLQKPCPAYCPYPLLCAWPRSQENHPAQGPHRELRLQLYHWARPYEKMLQALWLSPEHVSARVPGEQLLSLIPAYMLPWKEPGSQEL